MIDTQNTTPEGSGELTVDGAANAILGLMGGEEGSEQEQPELQAEAIASPSCLASCLAFSVLFHPYLLSVRII